MGCGDAGRGTWDVGCVGCGGGGGGWEKKKKEEREREVDGQRTKSPVTYMELLTQTGLKTSRASKRASDESSVDARQGA